MDVFARDPQFARFLALLLGFLLVVLWLRTQPEWLLVVLPIFALTFIGFDRLADGSAALIASGDLAQLVIGAVLMACPAFAVGFALGRRARRPDYALEHEPYRVQESVAVPEPAPSPTSTDSTPVEETVIVRPAERPTDAPRA